MEQPVLGGQVQVQMPADHPYGGIYLLQVVAGDKQYTRKLLIER